MTAGVRAEVGKAAEVRAVAMVVVARVAVARAEARAAARAEARAAARVAVGWAGVRAAVRVGVVFKPYKVRVTEGWVRAAVSSSGGEFERR